MTLAIIRSATNWGTKKIQISIYFCSVFASFLFSDISAWPLAYLSFSTILKKILGLSSFSPNLFSSCSRPCLTQVLLIFLCCKIFKCQDILWAYLIVIHSITSSKHLLRALPCAKQPSKFCPCIHSLISIISLKFFCSCYTDSKM